MLNTAAIKGTDFPAYSQNAPRYSYSTLLLRNDLHTLIELCYLYSTLDERRYGNELESAHHERDNRGPNSNPIVWTVH